MPGPLIEVDGASNEAATLATFLTRGFPALADAARRAFPGAEVRGCRDIEMHTNRDDKRVSV